jgi:16S rRNA (adenine1518-N6/adenine1519-N6)-dimethyltransferase
MHRAKKSLGQNFLKSKEALLKIIEAGDIKPEDIVLEIGPGKGALTEFLIQKAGKVIVIEKDRELVPLLEETFKDAVAAGKLEIREGDILEFNPSQLKEIIQKNSYSESSITSNNSSNKSYKLIANIPYYITGAIIQQFLTADFQPERTVLLLQKEVAQRIVARPEYSHSGTAKESILSISVKVYGTPKYISTVKAKYFSPQPKVDSGILLIENISRNFFKDINEERFFEIMKAGFAHKRKMLLGNLKEYFEKNNVSNSRQESTNLEEIFDNLNINKKARAEDLTLEQWSDLVKNLS